MGEPVTTGMMIGAATGALTNQKNPIQGAMLGGAMGAAGGSFYGGAAGAANPTIGSFAPNFMSGGAVTQSAGAAPTFMQQLSAGGQGLMSDIGGINKFMNQNPVTSQIGFGLAKQAFTPDQPMPMAPPGQVNRSGIQPIDYMSLLNPQNQTVIRPATPSLI